MLPRATHSLGLAWYIFECLNLFSCVCELKVRFAAGVSLLDGIELSLEVFKFDGEVSILIVKIVVVMDLAGESPVIMDEECIM